MLMRMIVPLELVLQSNDIRTNNYRKSRSSNGKVNQDDVCYTHHGVHLPIATGNQLKFLEVRAR